MLKTAAAFISLGAALACPASQAFLVSAQDAERAALGKPRTELTAIGAQRIRMTLNQQFLSQHSPVGMPRARRCEDFSIEMLARLQRELMCLRDDKMASSYQDGRAAKHKDVESLSQQQKAEAAYAAEHHEATDAIRDAMCHELAMSWVHHLSADARQHVVNKTELALPLLPTRGLEEHSEALAGRHPKVISTLAASVTCIAGHAGEKHERGVWEGFPNWPFEVEYNASGYGPYPFWTLGGGSGGSLSGAGTPIQSWWSDVLNAERLDHASCNMAGVGATDGVPCTHLFLDGQWSYLFTQDESFCCISGLNATYDACHMSRSQRNIADAFNYDGIIDYTSEDGLVVNIKAKKYSMHLTTPANFWFWYITDMDGKPLEQGEGPCDMYDTSGTRNCIGPPKMLFHQYHPGKFKNVTIDPSVFKLPEICLRAPYKYCTVQPTFFCSGV